MENGVDGIIVPMDNEKCAESIYWVLKNEDELQELKNNCKKREYSKAKEIRKMYELIKKED